MVNVIWTIVFNYKLYNVNPKLEIIESNYTYSAVGNVDTIS